MAFVFQLCASLAAIVVLAWLAHRLRLGGDARIDSDDDVRALADEALHGFEPMEIARDRGGLAALCRDGEGRLLLLRRHGSHWAARLLETPARAQLVSGVLTLASEDRRFGSVTLDLGEDAPGWAARLAHPAARDLG